MASREEGAYLLNGGENIRWREEELPQTKHDSVRVIKVYWVEEIMMLQRKNNRNNLLAAILYVKSIFMLSSNLVVIALCSVPFRAKAAMLNDLGIFGGTCFLYKPKHFEIFSTVEPPSE